MHLSALAAEAAALAAVGALSLPQRALALAAMLVGRHGYAGDAETYDDLANANLARVIERRRGLPVSLGILWLHTAQAAGWAACGIDFPGHFLIALLDEAAPRVPRAQILLDVFAGGGMLEQRALRRLRRDAAEMPADADLLRPMSTLAVLLRLQNNIKLRLLQQGAVAEALACAETMLAIAPQEAVLWHEAAVLNQRLDRVSAALRCFTRFLALTPKGEAAARARAAISRLRARLN
jgi:regulator of sirC expression with transglutaminase-like and TPR domain